MSRKYKPVGTNGMLHLTSINSTYIPTEYPKQKEDIELMIATGAIRNSNNFYDFSGLPKNNNENDFDFSVNTTTGEEYLELTEFVMNMEKGGYANAPQKYTMGEMADAAWYLIEKKEKHYGGVRTTPIHLLLYSTDFKFLLHETVIALLKIHCKRNLHHFKSIAYYAAITDLDGIFNPLYPCNIDVGIETNEDEFRGLGLTQLNMNSFIST